MLAGDLGPVTPQVPRGQRRTPPPRPAIPVFVTAAPARVSSWLKPVGGKPGVFRSAGAGRDADLDFVPFYRLHRHVYGAYWDILTPAAFERRASALRAAQERQRTLEAATVAFVQPGQMQAERDFNQQGGTSSPVQLQGRYGRRAADWFSFDVPVDAAAPLSLVVTYNRDERAARTFDILVDGAVLAQQAIPRRSPQEREDFFDASYPIPAAAVAGKQKVTVRFQGSGGAETATVFGIRVVKAGQ